MNSNILIAFLLITIGNVGIANGQATCADVKTSFRGERCCGANNNTQTTDMAVLPPRGNFKYSSEGWNASEPNTERLFMQMLRRPPTEAEVADIEARSLPQNWYFTDTQMYIIDAFNDEFRAAWSLPEPSSLNMTSDCTVFVTGMSAGTGYAFAVTMASAPFYCHVYGIARRPGKFKGHQLASKHSAHDYRAVNWTANKKLHPWYFGIRNVTQDVLDRMHFNYGDVRSQSIIQAALDAWKLTKPFDMVLLAAGIFGEMSATNMDPLKINKDYCESLIKDYDPSIGWDPLSWSDHKSFRLHIQSEDCYCTNYIGALNSVAVLEKSNMTSDSTFMNYIASISAFQEVKGSYGLSKQLGRTIFRSQMKTARPDLLSRFGFPAHAPDRMTKARVSVVSPFDMVSDIKTGMNVYIDKNGDYKERRASGLRWKRWPPGSTVNDFEYEPVRYRQRLNNKLKTYLTDSTQGTRVTEKDQSVTIHIVFDGMAIPGDDPDACSKYVLFNESVHHLSQPCTVGWVCWISLPLW